jgi:hypothetical protein
MYILEFEIAKVMAMAMAMATGSPHSKKKIKIYVSAIISMHGSTRPKEIPTVARSKHLSSVSHYYELTSQRLPPDTSLIAPQILGKSYFENRESTDLFLRKLITQWRTTGSPDHEYFSDFLLSKLNEFEKSEFGDMRKLLEANDRELARVRLFELKKPHLSKKYLAEQATRLDIEAAAAEKSGVNWGRQPVTIKQKSYSIRTTDRYPNCIKFFCDNLDLASPSTFSLFVPVKLLSFDVFVKVEYDHISKLFTITFPSHNPHNRFTFENLDQILRTVLEQIARYSTIAASDADNLVFVIDFFDFTCYDTIFPQDGRLKDLTPHLLSYKKLPGGSGAGSGVAAELIFGTIDKYNVEEEKYKRIKYDSGLRHGDSDAEGISSVSTHDDSIGSSIDSSIDASSPHVVRWPSGSAAASSNPVLVVQVDAGVASFVNFEPNVHPVVPSSPLFTPRSPNRVFPGFIQGPDSDTKKHKRRRSPSPKRRKSSHHSPSIGGRQRTRVIKRVYRKRFTVRRRGRRGGSKTLRLLGVVCR